MGYAIYDFFLNFQHNSIINQTRGSNITMPHLSKPWLQSTSVSVLESLLDQTKVLKLCCHEIVSDQVKRTKVESSDSSSYPRNWGGEGGLSSKLPKLHGLWLPSASHIILKLSYVIVQLLVCVRQSVSQLTVWLPSFGLLRSNYVIVQLLLCVCVCVPL